MRHRAGAARLRRAHGGTISLAVVRLPASDPGRRIGSLFVSPGGPGASGFDRVLFAAPTPLNDDVRARFDIVGFDPRGRHPKLGPPLLRQRQAGAPFFTPFAFPVTDAEEAIWQDADRSSPGSAISRAAGSDRTSRPRTSHVIWTRCARRSGTTS